MSALPAIVRLLVFLVAAAASLAAAMVLCKTPSEAAHLAVVPGFVIFLLLFRRGIFRKVAPRHVVYLGVLTALAAGYMWGLAYVNNSLTARWRELVVAVYFLVSIHIVVWVVFRLLIKVVCAIFSIREGARVGPMRRAAAGVVCGLLFLATVSPYLAATFLIHWVKFTDVSAHRFQPGMRFEEARFEATDGAVVGGLFVHAGRRPSDATVILAPCRAPGNSAAMPYVQMLADSGYNVLLLEHRGQGTSEGHTYSFGVLETNDVLGALRYLRFAYPKASKHVFGFGLSEGARPMLAAAAADKRIKAVVVDSASPRINLPLDGYTRAMPGPLGTYLRWATLVAASAELGCDLFEAEPIRNIRRMGGRPVLIVHGEADQVVPVREAQELLAAAGESAALWKVPEARHGETLLQGVGQYYSYVRRTFEPLRRKAPPKTVDGDPQFPIAHRGALSGSPRCQTGN